MTKRKGLRYFLLLAVTTTYFVWTRMIPLHSKLLPAETETDVLCSDKVTHTTTITETWTITKTVSYVESFPTPSLNTRLSIPVRFQPYISAIERTASPPPTDYALHIPNYLLRTWKTNSRDAIYASTASAYRNATSSRRSIDAWFRSWDIQNPNHVQLLFQDDDADRFVRGFFSEWVVAAYFKLPRTVMRSDLVRYLMLYKIGGVYTDMDTECIQPIYRWTHGQKGIGLLVGVENARGNRDNINQWTIGSAQHHPFMAKVVFTVVSKIHEATNDELEDVAKVLWITGPGIWKPAVHEYLQELGATVPDVSYMWDGYKVFGDCMVLGKLALATSNGLNPKSMVQHFGTGKLPSGWKVSNASDSLISRSERQSQHLNAMKWIQEQDSFTGSRPFQEVLKVNPIHIRSSNIPKRIMQAFYTSNVSDLHGSYQRYIESWKTLNPDFESFLWDDEGMESFIRKYGTSSDKAAYLRAPLLHQRYALFKFIWLARMGGIFADADSECRRSFSLWTGNESPTNVYIGVHNQTHWPFPKIATYVIGSAKNHSFIVSHLEALKSIILKTSKRKLKTDMTFLDVQKLFDQHVRSYLKEQGLHASVWVDTLSWESRVVVKDVTVFGQAMFRPDELERNTSLVKNHNTIWKRERVWGVSWGNVTDPILG